MMIENVLGVCSCCGCDILLKVLDDIVHFCCGLQQRQEKCPNYGSDCLSDDFNCPLKKETAIKKRNEFRQLIRDTIIEKIDEKGKCTVLVNDKDTAIVIQEMQFLFKINAMMVPSENNDKSLVAFVSRVT